VEGKVKKSMWIAGFCLAAALAATAQAPAGNAVTSTAQRLLERLTRNLMGTAETMPEDKYGYRPTPEEMGFGASIAHIAEVNNFSCSKFADVPMPQTKVTEKDSKEKLVAALKESLDYCTQQLAKLDDAKLQEPITFFGGRPATRAAAMFELLDDLSDHYASLSVYLRLNGLLPPSAQPKK
jgi:DinB family protein